MHDPPDKALAIRGHVPRASDNARIAAGDHVSKKILEEAVSSADPLASSIERFPMPTAGDKGERTVGPVNGQLQIFHPLSAASRLLPVPELNEQLTQNEQDQLRTVVAGLPGDGSTQARNRFLAIWRLWSETLADNVDKCFPLLPADTRTPDHTLWNHLDITAAFQAALSGKYGGALLAFALGPVQRFIEDSRTVRDLWSGSMILSWLAFRAMQPILEQFGPTAFIYPALRGIPLVDLWLQEQLGENKVPLPPLEQRRTPSLPHRFLALVPWGADGQTAKHWANECRQAAQRAVQELADAVHGVLDQHLHSLCPDWDKRWEDQVKNYFSFATAVVPLAGSGEEVDERLARLLAGKDAFQDAFPNAEAVRELARAIPPNDRPNYDQEHAGRWQYQVELVQRSLAAHRSIRHVPANPSVNANERFPQKCSLLGSFEQMGPDELAESRRFWDQAAQQVNVHGVRIRPGEALCAVALMKRFAGPALLAKELQIPPNDLRFPDTWTIAAAEWLHQAGIDPNQVRKQYRDWNGRWLHWPRRDHDPEEASCPEALFEQIQQAKKQHGKPPIYYAILKLDGDNLGGWLRGDNSPRVREVMHPELVSYYEKLGERARAGLEVRRPVGPALHAAISTALTNFALHVVPDVVAKHHGVVIYSGGDDTLALLPVRTVLACAQELKQTYTANWYPYNGREYLMMGCCATISGGIVIAHAMDNLRLALQDARRAEHHAKETGRDAVAIIIRRRSGEHTTAVCPWHFVDTVKQWVDAFRNGASDRWAYHLRAACPTLVGLPREAIEAEMRRRLGRAERPTPQLIPPDQLVEAFRQFCNSTVAADGASRPRFPSSGVALQNFLTLCQSASFMARGRDE
jgi:CRISPR-associated protein Cmr2